MDQICAICESQMEILDVVDFNKNCEELRGYFLKQSGIPIYYSICTECNFTSCDSLRSWTEKDFIEKIYNDDYIKIDPDYEKIRPLNNANFIKKIFHNDKSKIRHLDYGGGNGTLSIDLYNNDWDSNSFDPFPKNNLEIDQLGKYNLITAFEVFEHVPNPNQIMHDFNSLITDDGLIIFSTLLSDGHLKKNNRINWWYCSPRNGHVSLFSSKSIKFLAQKFSYNVGSFNDGLHVLFRQVPDWARDLISPEL